MIKDPVTLLCLLAVLLTQQPALTLISVVVLPLCFLPIIIYGRKVRKSARAMQTNAAESVQPDARVLYGQPHHQSL